MPGALLGIAGNEAAQRQIGTATNASDITGRPEPETGTI